MGDAAYGAVCASTGASGIPRHPAYIVVDLTGGAQLPGSNIMVGGRGGQKDFLPEYDTIGLPAGLHPSLAGVDERFGLAFHPRSALLAGIVEKFADTEAQQKVEGGAFASASSDDTQNNEHNSCQYIAKLLGRGELASVIGSSPTNSGGHAAAPADSYSPLTRSTHITGVQDLVNIVSPGRLGTFVGAANAPRVEKILALIHRMSAQQLKSFESMFLADQIKVINECAYQDSEKLISAEKQAEIAPPTDVNLTAIVGNNLDTTLGRAMILARAILKGHATTGTIALGGYDYHDKTRTTANGKEREAGQVIGGILEYARRINRAVMIVVVTDGGIVTDKTQADPTLGFNVCQADSGERSVSFTLVFNPTEKPKIIKPGRQIGWYTGQSVDRGSSKIGGSPDALAKAHFANYLALLGREGEFSKFVTNDPFRSELEDYLIFSKLG